MLIIVADIELYTEPPPIDERIPTLKYKKNIKKDPSIFLCFTLYPKDVESSYTLGFIDCYAL